VQQRIKRWSKKAFFRARTTFSQSLLVTDDTFKLDYASVIFVDPAVHIDKTSLNSLTTVAVCIQEHGSAHTNMLVHSIRVSQGSVAARFGCGAIFDNGFIANFSRESASERI